MTNNVATEIGEVVAAMRGSANLSTMFASLPTGSNPAVIPYYDYGHRLVIANKLLSTTAGKSYTYQKYPLIALRLDTNEAVEGDFVKYRLNIGIFSFTQKNYTAQQRDEFVFGPILMPLYTEFMEALYNSGLFSWSGDHLLRPKHTMIKRYFWGTPAEEKNEKNIFNDPLDAIEILNMEVNSKIRC